MYENFCKIENDQVFLVTSVFNNGGVFINANKFTVDGNTTNKKGAQMTPGHQKLRLGDQKRLQKYVTRLVLYQQQC